MKHNDTFTDILKIGFEHENLTRSRRSSVGAHTNEDVLPVGQLQLEVHARGPRELWPLFSLAGETGDGGPAAVLNGAEPLCQRSAPEPLDLRVLIYEHSCQSHASQ